MVRLKHPVSNKNNDKNTKHAKKTEKCDHTKETITIETVSEKDQVADIPDKTLKLVS